MERGDRMQGWKVLLVLLMVPLGFGSCAKTARASDCGLLVDFFVGCDVVTQDLRISEQETQKAAIQAQADSESARVKAQADADIAQANSEATQAQAEADMWAEKYKADASVEVAEAAANAQMRADLAFARTDELRAEWAAKAQIQVAESDNDARVGIEQIKANSAFELGVLPYAGIAIAGIIIYMMYIRHTDTKVKMAQFKALNEPKDPYAGLVPWQRRMAEKADERCIQWMVTRDGFEFNHPTDGWKVFRPNMIEGKGE